MDTNTDIIKKAQLSVKMPVTLLDGLQEIYRRTGCKPTELLRRLGAAAVEFSRQNDVVEVEQIIKRLTGPAQKKKPRP